MEMKDRIAKIIKKEQLTSQQFAEIVDMQSSTISHILAGRNLPSFKIIANLLEKFPYISPDWLIFGNGEMYRAKEASSDAISSGEENTPNVPQSPIFTKVDSTDVIPEEVLPREEEEELSFEDDIEIESSVKENNRPIDTTSITLAVPEKIIIMYSDKTFEVFNAK